MVKKFDKIRAEGKDPGATIRDDEFVVVEEKLDGANFRVWLDEDGTLRFGSRQVEFPKSIPGSDVGYGAFHAAVEYIKSLDTSCLEYGYIYFFEAMHKHTLNYDWSRTPPAVLLDVYFPEEDEYMYEDMVAETAKSLGCDKASVIFIGFYEQFDGKLPTSVYGDFEAEGIIIKPQTVVERRDEFGNIHRAKVVGDAFKEENREVFGDPNDKESAFVSRFATAARVDKMIHKLQDAKGEEPHPSWIPILGYNLFYDICTEELKRLLKIGTPNLKTIRKECEREVKLRLAQLGILTSSSEVKQ